MILSRLDLLYRDSLSSIELAARKNDHGTQETCNPMDTPLYWPDALDCGGLHSPLDSL